MASILDLMGNVQDGFERGRARAKQSTLASLMGQAFTTPEGQRPQLYGSIAQIGGPDAATSVQRAIEGMDEGRRRDFGRMVSAFVALPKDQKPAAYGPIAQRAQTEFGIPVPQGPYQDSFDAGMARIGQLYGSGTGLPSGYQEFDLMANDANLSPDERATAARRQLYMEPRPSNAAIKYMVVTGPDRRRRVVALDPNQVGAQVLGSGEMYGSGVGGNTNNAPGSDHADQVAQMAQSMLDSGIPPEMIDRWIASQPDRDVAPPAANPFVSSTPGEDAYDQETGKQRADIEFAPERGRIDAANAGQRAAAEVAGKAGAEAQFNLPKIEQSANLMLKAVRDLKNDPALRSVVGLDGKFNPKVYIPGTDEQRALARIKQINGQVFLQAYQTLRGGGQITEVEGEKATAAMGRLDRAQSYDDYIGALNDLEEVITSALNAARRQAAGSQNNGSAGRTLRYNPNTRDFE